MVCGTPSSDFKEQQRLANTNIPPSLMKSSHVIFLRGRVVIQKLSLMDRFALKFATSMVNDSVKRKEMTEGYDEVSRTNMVDVIKKVRAYLQVMNVQKAESNLA